MRCLHIDWRVQQFSVMLRRLCVYLQGSLFLFCSSVAELCSALKVSPLPLSLSLYAFLVCLCLCLSRCRCRTRLPGLWAGCVISSLGLPSMTPAATPAWLLGWRGSLASPPTSAGSVALLCVFLMLCVCVCVCCTLFVLVMCGSSNSG